jgi:oxygen-independent coproporphyrinogen-3 oxidase
VKRKRPRLTGVYVHLPFCDVKCAYCDFYSLANRHVDEKFWLNYGERLLEDLRRQYAELALDTQQPVLASIFFGGGTPSKAPGFVFARIIRGVREIFPRYLDDVEISAEANPESLTQAVLAEWRGAGVNRISVGMQSRDEPVLKYLGRIYNPASYREVLAKIRKAGFSNFNADFITGVPGQSVHSTVGDLDFALAEGVTHLSLYQLTVESGTLLKQRIESGKIVRPGDAQQVRQMDAGIDFLEQRGFRRYEISNFARDNHTCLHYLLYWTGRPYL